MERKIRSASSKKNEAEEFGKLHFSFPLCCDLTTVPLGILDVYNRLLSLLE